MLYLWCVRVSPVGTTVLYLWRVGVGPVGTTLYVPLQAVIGQVVVRVGQTRWPLFTVRGRPTVPLELIAVQFTS